MKNELIKRFGEHRVMDIPIEEGEMPLIMLDLESKVPVNVLMTNGLSNYKMPVHEKEEGKEYNELCFCLPGYWEWEDRQNPNTNWIFHWIQRLAKYVIDNETWFGHGHTMPCGKDMEPLSATMQQNHFILINPMMLEMEMAPVQVDGHDVHFLFIVPIFGDEMDYKQGKGTQKLITKFINKGMNEQLDDFRGNALKRRWSFRK